MTIGSPSYQFNLTILKPPSLAFWFQLVSSWHMHNGHQRGQNYQSAVVCPNIITVHRSYGNCTIKAPVFYRMPQCLCLLNCVNCGSCGHGLILYDVPQIVSKYWSVWVMGPYQHERVVGSCGTILVRGRCGVLLVWGSCGVLLVWGSCGVLLVWGSCGVLLVLGACGILAVVASGTLLIWGSCGNLMIWGSCRTLLIWRSCQMLLIWESYGIL